MKQIIQGYVLWFVGICLGVSFGFSLIRFIGHDECSWEHKDPKDINQGLVKVCPNTACAPLFIDRLEPFVSTRWFCELR